MLSIFRKWVVSVTGLTVGFCVEDGFGVFVATGLVSVLFNIKVGEVVEIGWAGGVVSSIFCGEQAEMIRSRRSMLIKNRFCRFMTSIIAVVRSWSILRSRRCDLHVVSTKLHEHRFSIGRFSNIVSEYFIVNPDTTTGSLALRLPSWARPRWFTKGKTILAETHLEPSLRNNLLNFVIDIFVRNHNRLIALTITFVDV